MQFSTVTAINIHEGSVIGITRKTTGQILWRKCNIYPFTIRATSGDKTATKAINLIVWEM